MERVITIFKRFQIDTNYSTVLDEIGNVEFKVQDDRIPRFIHTVNTETDCQATLSPCAEYVEIIRS